MLFPEEEESYDYALASQQVSSHVSEKPDHTLEKSWRFYIRLKTCIWFFHSLKGRIVSVSDVNKEECCCCRGCTEGQSNTICNHVCCDRYNCSLICLASALALCGQICQQVLSQPAASTISRHGQLVTKRCCKCTHVRLHCTALHCYVMHCTALHCALAPNNRTIHA